LVKQFFLKYNFSPFFFPLFSVAVWNAFAAPYALRKVGIKVIEMLLATNKREQLLLNAIFVV
jgi:hypothetical protein